MKRYLNIIAVILLVLSCSQYEIAEMSLTEQNEGLADYDRTMVEDSTLLTELGYSIFKIEDYDDSYIVNDLLVFDKRDLMQWANNNPSTKLSRSFNVDRRFQRMAIEVNYFGSSSGEELGMIENAMSAWNSLNGCNVFFCYSGDGSVNHSEWMVLKIDIYSAGCLYDKMITLSERVGQNEPVRMMTLNTALDIWKNASDQQKEYAFMHMLGLAMGLTDYRDSNNQVVGSYGVDNYSIMRRYTDLASHPNDCWDGFSYADRLDIPKAFPIVADDIDVELSNPAFDNVNYVFSGEQTITADAVFDLPSKGVPNYWLDYNITLYNKTSGGSINNVDGTNYLVCDFVDNCEYELTIEVLNENAGAFQVIKKQYTINVISDPKVTVNYPTEVSINADFLVTFQSPYGNPKIDISACETLFDKNGNNCIVTKVEDNQYKIKLLDYGSYEIACSMSGNEDISRLVVSEFYRPDYQMSHTSWLEDLEYVAYDATTGNRSILIPENSTPSPRTGLYITLEDNDTLSNRFYGIIYDKYYFNVLYANCLEHGLFIRKSRILKLNKGANSVYSLPVINNYSYDSSTDPSAVVDTLGNYTASFIGFYALHIPKDSIIFEE